jgi:hypothetical protein
MSDSEDENDVSPLPPLTTLNLCYCAPPIARRYSLVNLQELFRVSRLPFDMQDRLDRPPDFSNYLIKVTYQAGLPVSRKICELSKTFHPSQTSLREHLEATVPDLVQSRAQVIVSMGSRHLCKFCERM